VESETYPEQRKRSRLTKILSKRNKNMVKIKNYSGSHIRLKKELIHIRLLKLAIEHIFSLSKNLEHSKYSIGLPIPCKVTARIFQDIIPSN
jgi:hypothetical protein